MSALAKKLSDEDRTSEFQIPEGLLKQKTEEIQEKHAAVSQELEAVKKELPRKLDESTNVFTLRQVEMAHKVEELETKKSDFENELLALLQKQKKQINGDLQKVSKYIQQESKKNATLDKNILARISQLANTREEMQEEITALKESQKKSHMHLQDLRNGHSDVVYKLHSEFQQSRNFEKAWQQNQKDLQETVFSLKEEIHQLKLEVEKNRGSEKKWQQSLAEFKANFSLPEVAPARDWQPEISELKASLEAMKEQISRPVAPVVVEVKKDHSDNYHQKKEIFQKHLESILSPDQQDIVFEMLDDFFASLRKK